MENYIIIAIVVLIVALAVAYVARSKKKGVKCIGCPEGGDCSNCSGSCNNSR